MITLFALLFVGCVSTNYHPSLDVVRNVARQDCQLQIQSRLLTYQKPINCPACSHSDHTTYLIDQLWHSVITRKWYAGHGSNESHLDIRTHLWNLSPSAVYAMDSMSLKSGKRIHAGGDADLFLRAVIDGCREATNGNHN